MTDYEALAKRLDDQGPIPSVLLCREAAAALRKLLAERDNLTSELAAMCANHLAAHDMAAQLRAQRDREDRLLLADWHHSVKDGKHVWRTFLNLGVPGHWSDGSTLIEVIDADRATAARLAEEKLDAPPPA